ncbi:acyl-protein synthetase [candidate division GN15 bacterium]|nr:acyl-protein synthetase [candidate division GN15 bacterium]
MALDDVLATGPYSLSHDDKQQLLVEHLNRLTQHHAEQCDPYRRILQAYGKDKQVWDRVEDVPFLPISLFKEFALKSIPDDAVVKTLTSSGTTGQKVSRIFLDKETSRYQTKALAAIMQDFIGGKRLPMLILDTQNVIKDRRLFSARGAGILGLSNFGRDHLYVLDNDMQLRADELKEFLATHRDTDILLFGFTFMVWKHFYQEIKRLGLDIDLARGVLIHSGGWKKLTDEAVDNASFKKALNHLCGLERIHNFYGMVEQIGSIYMEGDTGCFQTPIFSDIIIRDPIDWSVLPAGREGIIELVSILPHSYPGHVLLTEDLGRVIGEDDSPDGRQGKYFEVLGRVPKAEIRGCSDTYAEEVSEGAV